MSEICEYCEVLDIAGLLGDSKDINPSLAARLVRYYCQNPETDNDYCPNHGQKEKCIYHRLLALNQEILK